MKLPAKHAKIISNAIIAAQVDYQMFYECLDKGETDNAELFKKAHAKAINTLRSYGIDIGRTIDEIDADLKTELAKHFGWDTAEIE